MVVLWQYIDSKWELGRAENRWIPIFRNRVSYFEGTSLSCDDRYIREYCSVSSHQLYIRFDRSSTFVCWNRRRWYKFRVDATMRPNLSLCVAGLSGAMENFSIANQLVFNFYVFLRPVDVPCIRCMCRCIYDTRRLNPSESGTSSHPSHLCITFLFFREFPLHRPPPSSPFLSLLSTCHHMTPFSRPILRLCCPKRYTNSTEFHKNHPRKKRR